MQANRRSLALVLPLVLALSGASWSAPQAPADRDSGARNEPVQLAQAGAQEQVQMQQIQQELNAAQQNLQRLRGEEAQEGAAKGLKKRPQFDIAERHLENALRRLREPGVPSYYKGARYQATARITQALELIGKCEKIDRQHGCCK